MEKYIEKKQVNKPFIHKKIALLADKYEASAGVIDLAVRKSVEIANGKPKDFHFALTNLLSASTQLMANGKINKLVVNEQNYSLEGLNLNVNIKEVLSQLEMYDNFLRKKLKPQCKTNMNLLLYGPPGTGKTEFSRYVGKHLGRNIMIKRSSDLLDKYVGATEQNIAKVFREAENSGKILVIDEIDSLIFDRSIAIHSWETSQVNEFLTQVEEYSGFLICTTNRLHEIDSAALRRFNHKIKFDFLTCEGNLIFYRKMLDKLAIKQVSQQAVIQVKTLTNLTPGDFKVVQNKYQFYSSNQIQQKDLVKSLVAEVNIKQIHTSKIGFVL